MIIVDGRRDLLEKGCRPPKLSSPLSFSIQSTLPCTTDCKHQSRPVSGITKIGGRLGGSLSATASPNAGSSAGLSPLDLDPSEGSKHNTEQPTKIYPFTWVCRAWARYCTISTFPSSWFRAITRLRVGLASIATWTFAGCSLKGIPESTPRYLPVWCRCLIAIRALP